MGNKSAWELLSCLLPKVDINGPHNWSEKLLPLFSMSKIFPSSCICLPWIWMLHILLIAFLMWHVWIQFMLNKLISFNTMPTNSWFFISLCHYNKLFRVHCCWIDCNDRFIRYYDVIVEFESLLPNLYWHTAINPLVPRVEKNGNPQTSALTHSFLIVKQLFPGFLTFFYAIFKFLRPEHDCYVKFKSCST